MLTARDQLDDRLQGFVPAPTITWSSPSPFPNFPRIEAVLRRAQGGGRRELSVADLS